MQKSTLLITFFLVLLKVVGTSQTSWQRIPSPNNVVTNFLYGDNKLYALTSNQLFQSDNHGDSWTLLNQFATNTVLNQAQLTRFVEFEDAFVLATNTSSNSFYNNTFNCFVVSPYPTSFSGFSGYSSYSNGGNGWSSHFSTSGIPFKYAAYCEETKNGSFYVPFKSGYTLDGLNWLTSSGSFCDYTPPPYPNPSVEWLNGKVLVAQQGFVQDIDTLDFPYSATNAFLNYQRGRIEGVVNLDGDKPIWVVSNDLGLTWEDYSLNIDVDVTDYHHFSRYHYLTDENGVDYYSKKEIPNNFIPYVLGDYTALYPDRVTVSEEIRPDFWIVCFDDGSIIRSVDGGHQWTALKSPSEFTAVSIVATTPNRVWYKFGGKNISQPDGWTPDSPGSLDSLGEIVFEEKIRDHRVAVVVNPDEISVQGSKDGGISWDKIDIVIQGVITGMYKDGNEVFLVTENLGTSGNTTLYCIRVGQDGDFEYSFSLWNGVGLDGKYYQIEDNFGNRTFRRYNPFGSPTWIPMPNAIPSDAGFPRYIFRWKESMYLVTRDNSPGTKCAMNLLKWNPSNNVFEHYLNTGDFCELGTVGCSQGIFGGYQFIAHREGVLLFGSLRAYLPSLFLLDVEGKKVSKIQDLPFSSDFGSCPPYPNTISKNGLGYYRKGNELVSFSNYDGIWRSDICPLVYDSYSPQRKSVAVVQCGPFNFGDTTISQSGFYEFLHPNATGCIDTFQVKARIFPKTTPSVRDTSIYQGYRFLGVRITKDTIIRTEFLNQNNCDSLIIWNVKVLTDPQERFSGTNTNFSEFRLNVYPNPTNEVVTVSTISDQDNIHSVIRIQDSFGRIVLDKKLTHSDMLINLSALYPGIFWVSWQSLDDQRILAVQKLVVF